VVDVSYAPLSSAPLVSTGIVSEFFRKNVKKTRSWAHDRVHNSSRPLDRLFALFDPMTLTFDFLA